MSQGAASGERCSSQQPRYRIVPGQRYLRYARRQVWRLVGKRGGVFVRGVSVKCFYIRSYFWLYVNLSTMPIRQLLVGMSDAENHRFLERLAHDLQADRYTPSRKPTRQGDSR